MFAKEKSNDTITLEEKSSNFMEEERQLAENCFHSLEGQGGSIICSDCGQSVVEAINSGQSCPGPDIGAPKKPVVDDFDDSQMALPVEG